MLTFLRLGYKGNLGNHLFQIASIIGLAKTHNKKFCFPEWKYSEYFEYKFPEIDKSIEYETVNEKFFNFHEWDLGDGNYNINGWLQSEKYFDVKKVKEVFKFKTEFRENTLNKYKNIFNKKTVFVSVRRGDFVHNPNYFQLSFQYYILALVNNFPDLKERTIVFASDDIEYCKFHYSFLNNVVFLENVPPMEQMVIGIHCDDYVISNSTFSWWIAWLGETENKRVYRPIKNLSGEFGRVNNDRDYFPERWIAFDEKEYSLPLKLNYILFILKGNLFAAYIYLVFNIKFYWKKFKKKVKKIIEKQ